MGAASTPGGPGSLAVTWDDNSSIEDGYRVRWEPTAGGTQLQAQLPANTEAHTITGLEWNTQYDVEVVAFNGGGESNVLGPVALYTAPPAAPSACDATATGATTATIGWTLPATEPVTGYRIYRSPAGAGTWAAVGTVAAGVDTYAATGLTAETAYDFRVVGYNSNSAVSQPDSETSPSNTATCTTNAAITFPASATFDGTNDYMVKSGGLSGIADSKLATLSFWVTFNGGDGAQQIIFEIADSSNNVRLSCYKRTDNRIQFIARDASGNTVTTLYTSPSYTAASGRLHVLFRTDNTSTTARQCWVNGSSVSLLASNNVNTDIDLATTGDISIGASRTGASKLNAKLEELWFKGGAWVDASEFRNGSNPKDIGATGNGTTGGTPHLYLSRNGSGNDWRVDSSGNGNTFTVTGSLT